MKSLNEKRIALISYSGDYGGMELRMIDEACSLRDAGAKPVIFMRNFSKYNLVKEKASQNGIEMYRFSPPNFFMNWRLRRAKKKLAEYFWLPILVRANIDLIQVCMPWAHMGEHIVWLASKAGIPCVVSAHNVFPSSTGATWHEKCINESFDSVKGVYGNSFAATNAFQARYGKFLAPTTPVKTIHNGVDTNRLMPSRSARQKTRREWGIPLNACVLGTVGRLSPQKRPEYVLDVFESLHRDNDDLYFVFVGDGPLRPSLEYRIKQKGLQNSVRVVGFCDAVEDVYPALDLHLLLSEREGFASSTVEAMACGVAVAATNTQPSHELLSHCEGGILLPITDVEQTVHELQPLIYENDRLAAMGDLARSFAAAHFDTSSGSESRNLFFNELLK